MIITLSDYFNIERILLKKEIQFHSKNKSLNCNYSVTDKTKKYYILLQINYLIFFFKFYILYYYSKNYASLKFEKYIIKKKLLNFQLNKIYI